MLKRTNLEIANIKKEDLDAFFHAVSLSNIELHDFMLLRDSYVCCEATWVPYRKEDLHMLFSLSKAFTAIGIGFAVQEGLLTIDTPVYSIFREEMEQGGYAASIHSSAREITIEHLLTMSTGQEEEPPILNYEFDGNWIAKFLQITPLHKPGTAFFYDTTATYVLSAILTKITGVTLAEYLKPRFFTPLNITSYAWDQSPEGNSLGGIGLNLSIESIAKLGIFLLHEGKWQGKQLLNADWIRRMTSNLVCSAGGDVYDNQNNWSCGYGYQIWQCTPDSVYRGDGAYGQFVIVAPKENVIIATLSGTADMSGLLDAIWKYLLPACLPINPAQLKEAPSEKRSFTIPFPLGTNDLPKDLLATYSLTENKEGLEKINFDISSENVLSITCIFKNNQSRCLTFGYKTWQDNRIPEVTHDKYYTCSDIRTSQTSGSWAWSDNTLLLKLCYLNGPLGIDAQCTFTKNSLQITAQKNRSMSVKTTYKFIGRK